MRSLTLLVLLALAAAAMADTKLYDLAQADALFEQFVKDYNRQYKDAADRQLHLEAFKSNVQKINEHNSRGSSATFTINKFADYTEDEKKAMTGFKKP